MVKGTTRQVVILKSPQTQLFEQAIFFLREDCSADAQTLLEEARRLAQTQTVPRKRHLTGGLCALLGALPVGALWLLTTLLA